MGGLLHNTICQTQFMNRLIHTWKILMQGKHSGEAREKLATFRTYKECDDSFNMLKYSLLLRERFMSSWTKAWTKSIHCLDLFTQSQWSCSKWWLYMCSRVREVPFFQICNDNNICQILIVSDTPTQTFLCNFVLVLLLLLLIN